MKTAEQTSTIIAHVEDVKKLKNSPEGNPQYKIVTDRGTFLTRKNSMCAYAATNFRPRYVSLPGKREGVHLQRVKLTLVKSRVNSYIIGIEGDS